jgi:16S rRNA (uracil1498-N3)-methyltransferase
MRTIRIYQPGVYRVGDTQDLSQEAGLHVGVVLRMQPGDSLTLFCGDNREWDAQIIAVHKKKVTISIRSERVVNRESPLTIHLAQAISKSERMEWVIQKAVELGVSRISPIITQHGAYKLDEARLMKKNLQWQAIAIAACEQCGRNQLPEIAPAVSLDAFLQQTLMGSKYLLEPYTGLPFGEYDRPSGGVTLLIGPEGGLSVDEVQRSVVAGFSPVKMGPRILRTETAAICALGVVQALWGDL